MSHKHLLVGLGVALMVLGLAKGGWFLIAVWLGVDCLVWGIAHWRGAHRVFGKRPDGTLPWWSWALFWPLFLYSLAVRRLLRSVRRRERAFDVVNESLVVGRRLSGKELEGEFDNLVDLTAEFSEPSRLRSRPCYRNIPILDGSALSLEALRAAVESLHPGRTFVHCAQGHGRTGLFALAILLKSGAARDVEEGLRILRAARPGIRLSQEQQKCIAAFASLQGSARPPSASDDQEGAAD